MENFIFCAVIIESGVQSFAFGMKQTFAKVIQRTVLSKPVQS